MPKLIAIAHILGTVIALSALGFPLLFVAAWESKRNDARVLQEIAAKLGVPVTRLEDESLRDRIIKICFERSSNELLRNRLSDLCGVIRTLWGWLGLLVQVGAIGGTIWYTATEDLDNAVYAWAAVGIAIFFCLASVAFSLVCYFLTGRFPGEAKLARKGLTQFLNKGGPVAN